MFFLRHLFVLAVLCLTLSSSALAQDVEAGLNLEGFYAGTSNTFQLLIGIDGHHYVGDFFSLGASLSLGAGFDEGPADFASTANVSLETNFDQVRISLGPSVDILFGRQVVDVGPVITLAMPMAPGFPCRGFFRFGWMFDGSGPINRQGPVVAFGLTPFFRGY